MAVLLGLGACSTMGPGSDGGSRPYAVFFTDKSAALEPAGLAVIAAAAKAAAAAPAQRVLVVGHTDVNGSPPADVLLSRDRASHVADALVADGVAPARIVQHGRGQTGEDPGVENRRVDISLIP